MRAEIRKSFRIESFPKEQGGITSVSDEPVQSLLRRLTSECERKWPALKTRLLNELPRNAFPQELHHTFEAWLRANRDVFPSLTNRIELYESIDAILLRSYHALDCIGEKKQHQEAAGEPRYPREARSNSSGPPQGLADQRSVATSGQTVRYGPKPAKIALHDPPVPRSNRNRHRMLHHEIPLPTQAPPLPLANTLKVKGLSTYHWLFLSFWTVFFPKLDGSNELRDSDKIQDQSSGPEHIRDHGEVLLCFDDASGTRIQKIDWAALGERWASGATPNPSNLLPLVVEEIIHTYDDALWGFRIPVRDIEKRRPMRKEKAIQAKVPRGEGEQQLSRRLETYTNMHELSRHLVHAQETLNAAETTLQAILRSKHWGRTIDTEIFEFCHTFIINLKLRAGAFVDRLNNEISLV
ncbi:hypothetical protein LY76DRAFT_585272, partial [Colletotrichum caudatum]